MKAKKEIDKQIKLTIISTIIFVVVLIVTVVIVINSLFGYMKGAIRVGDFLLDYEDTRYIKENVKILSNSEGMKVDDHEITITNNGNETKEYYLYVKRKDGKAIDEHLMISLNNYIIKKSDSYEVEDGKYIIYEGSLKPGFSTSHAFRFWWEYNSPSEYDGKTIELEYGIVQK